MKKEHKFLNANDVKAISNSLAWFRINKVKLFGKDVDPVNDKLRAEEVDHLSELINVFREINEEMGSEIEIII